MTIASTYPAIGHAYEATFGEVAFLLDFNSDGKHLTFTSLNSGKPVAGAAIAVQYTAVLVRPGVFMVYWTEPDGSTVVHVQDFENDMVHTNFTTPDQKFLNFTGTFKRRVER